MLTKLTIHELVGVTYCMFAKEIILNFHNRYRRNKGLIKIIANKKYSFTTFLNRK